MTSSRLRFRPPAELRRTESRRDFRHRPQNLTVWECWLKDMHRLSAILAGLLDGVETVANHE